MRIGSLFSGIGGLELGLEWSGIGSTVWQVEQDKYCLGVLEKHWPNVERYTDVKTVGKENLEPVDLICGGFPCQDVSSAGKGAGLGGARSGLWFEFLRIVDELRPEWVVIENVAGGATRWVDPVMGGLEQQGYKAFPVPLSAADCGAPHLRRRVFIVANSMRSGTGKKHREIPREVKKDEKGTRRRMWSESSDGRKNVPNPNKARLREPRWLEKSPGGQEPTNSDWWQTEPNVGRVANGVPARVDRLKTLGNAVVPQCAQVVGEFIKQLQQGGKRK